MNEHKLPEDKVYAPSCFNCHWFTATSYWCANPNVFTEEDVVECGAIQYKAYPDVREARRNEQLCGRMARYFNSPKTNTEEQVKKESIKEDYKIKDVNNKQSFIKKIINYITL